VLLGVNQLQSTGKYGQAATHLEHGVRGECPRLGHRHLRHLHQLLEGEAAQRRFQRVVQVFIIAVLGHEFGDHRIRQRDSSSVEHRRGHGAGVDYD
jgi:hypothetical protein